MPNGVTALDFSSRSPNLLAVGTYDGSVDASSPSFDDSSLAYRSVLIYNLRKDQQTVSVPVLDSSSLPVKHMDPVWQVKWVDKV